MGEHVRMMLGYAHAGVRQDRVDYGNNIRRAEDGARGRRQGRTFDFPGFVPAYIRPLFCRGVGPFRWAALSGDPEDIFRTDEKVKELMPDSPALHNWLDMARALIQFQGLPARICWVGPGSDRHRLGLAFNAMVASGELKGADRHRPPIISIPARSRRPTAKPRRCRTAPTPSPIGRFTNALLTIAPSRRDLGVDPHHGGGVGMGFSQHAGMVVVCDGTPDAARRIERVLWN